MIPSIPDRVMPLNIAKDSLISEFSGVWVGAVQVDSNLSTVAGVLSAYSIQPLYLSAVPTTLLIPVVAVSVMIV